ncbi:hypothetical protein F5888DRAFT_1827820 [Russula emetica]|nr:hypothetical protein F5888DRAFT_1827820 [Russula emetica]
MGIPVIVDERFDTLSLARQIKNIGRAYQRQAIELVNLCRMFVETFPPEKRHNAMPKLTMLAIFEALRLAEVAGKKSDSTSRSMDDTIAEGMTRAKEKDERSLGLLNQLLERRGPNETSDLAQCQCANTPHGTHRSTGAYKSAGRMFTYRGYSHRDVPRTFPTRVDTRVFPDTYQAADSWFLLSPPPPHPFLQRLARWGLWRPAHTDHQVVLRLLPPPFNRATGKRVVGPQAGIPPHLLVPPSSHSPPQSTRTDPPPNAIDVAPTVSSERQKGTTQRSSNSLPQSEEKKVSPIHVQTKIKRSTRAKRNSKAIYEIRAIFSYSKPNRAAGDPARSAQSLNDARSIPRNVAGRRGHVLMGSG